MAENEDGQEKKHDPGEKKWREAAERGQVPKSADLGHAAVLFAVAATLTYGTDWFVSPMVDLSRRMFDVSQVEKLTIESGLALLREAMRAVAMAVMVPLTAAMFVGTIANLAQSRFQLATEAFEPKWDRLDPISGFQNAYFSWTPLVELGKGLGKIVFIGGAIWFVVRDTIADFPALAYVPPREVLTLMVEMGWLLILAATPVVLILGAADYAYSTYQLTEQLKRTDQEVKDDRKAMEGDPLIKMQRRRMGRKMIVGGGLAEVKTANVVITNPTHYAVALRYDRSKDIAPVVVAKGVDHLAQLIRTEALKQGVPRLEDRPLARALYAKVEIGHPIPEDLYAAVARILALVHRRRAKARARRAPGRR